MLLASSERNAYYLHMGRNFTLVSLLSAVAGGESRRKAVHGTRPTPDRTSHPDHIREYSGTPEHEIKRPRTPPPGPTLGYIPSLLRREYSSSILYPLELDSKIIAVKSKGLSY
ncbi:hypothetical protein OIU85_019569 [Salix viminalis]|uniref:Uncharacterized protein n=1 Tax=Salix viminalis TaxID=40686 RepID=A0A9Q0ZK97_SALVM|nr:hypothetical protein OIU85_019569 [Salix viminalis]